MILNKNTDISVSEEHLNEIRRKNMACESMRGAIGALVEKTLQLTAQSLSMRKKNEDFAKQAIISAGISEENVEKFKVEIETGRIVPRFPVEDENQGK